jgi:tight adherence protein C
MSAALDFMGNAFTALTSNRLALLCVIAMAVFLFTLGASYILTWIADPARRKLEALSPAQADLDGESWSNQVRRLIKPVARFVLPTDNKERGAMEKTLLHAGFRSSTAIPVFYALKTGLALLFLIAWLSCSILFPKLTSGQVMFYAIAAAFAGLVLPNFVLNRLLERRQKALRHAFPDALDMLVVCVESGLGLSAALQRVADELAVSHPELATELAQVNAETRAGVEREVALRHLADRTGLEDIRGLVGLLVQTMRFGTSVADSLRVYSEEFRDKRMQKAEEQAAKIGTKLIFPLVTCLFPGFFVVAVGPAVIRLVEAFSKMGASN